MPHADHAVALAHEMGLIVNVDARGRRVDSEALARGVARGTHLRLVPGVFVETASHAALSPFARFRMRLVATAMTMSPDVVFSHMTAATCLGLPVLGALPERIDVTIPPSSGGRSSGNVKRHAAPLDETEVVDLGGFLVTSPTRTVADIARTEGFTRAVATVDAALHLKRKPTPLITLDELAAVVEAQQGRHGAAKLRRVADFATPLSDSVRESESRCLIHLAGFPEPVLQQEWRDAAGLIGYTDFWWPAHDLIGEYDGHVKYVKPEFMRGRTLSKVIEDEKRREDRMRALGPRVARWATPELTIARLTRVLTSAGLPLVRAPRRA
jgi:hypothetical protein